MSVHAGAPGTASDGYRDVRDQADIDAAELWAKAHNHRDLTAWSAACPACQSNSADAFRRGYRAGLNATPTPRAAS